MSQVSLGNSDKWTLAIGAACFLIIVYFTAPILSPFLVSLVLAYLADPFVSWLARFRVPRTVGVLIAFAFFLFISLVIFAVLVPILWAEIHGLLAALPSLVNRTRLMVLDPIVVSLKLETFNLSGEIVKETLMSHWREVGSLANSLVLELGRSGRHFLGVLAYCLLVPVVTFYLLRDWSKLVKGLESLIPQQKIKTVKLIVVEIDDVLSEFFRGQLLIIGLLGLFYGLALRSIGLEYALIVGFVAGLVSFIPYFGAAVGIALASVIALGQFEQAWLYLSVIAIFLVGQLLESTVLSPILIGDKIGLHPVWIILAVMIGGHLFGFVGILLALPVAAIIRVLLSYFFTTSRLGDTPRQPE